MCSNRTHAGPRHGLTLVVDPVNMLAETWLLTGIPRSGSSLACRLAGDLPDVVALSEPMPRTEFAGLTTSLEACGRIRDFATRTRERIGRERRAPSLQVGGRLDDNVVSGHSDGGLRRRRAQPGEIRIRKSLSRRFTFLIKHNALFAALLHDLAVSFSCVALVRNPLVVLASWQTVDLPVNRGRIPAGEQFDGELRDALDRTDDVRSRQVLILNWFFERYGNNLPAERIVRYEDLVASGGCALFGLLGQPRAEYRPLASRNDDAHYRGVDFGQLLAALTDVGGAWTRFYSRADCEAAAKRLAARA